MQVTAVSGSFKQADSLIKENSQSQLSSINPLTISSSFKKLAQTLVC